MSIEEAIANLEIVRNNKSLVSTIDKFDWFDTIEIALQAMRYKGLTDSEMITWGVIKQTEGDDGR